MFKSLNTLYKDRLVKGAPMGNQNAAKDKIKEMKEENVKQEARHQEGLMRLKNLIYYTMRGKSKEK